MGGKNEMEQGNYAAKESDVTLKEEVESIQLFPDQKTCLQ
jgi:hypothetical protein